MVRAAVTLAALALLGACSSDGSPQRDDAGDRVDVHGGDVRTTSNHALVTSEVVPVMEDTAIVSTAPDLEHGTNTTVDLVASADAVALLRFDGLAIGAAVGSGTVTAADLVVPVNACTLTGTTVDVAVHELTQTWTEPGATWSCANDTVPANGATDCGATDVWDPSTLPPWTSTAVATQTVGASCVVELRFDVFTSMTSGPLPDGWSLVATGTAGDTVTIDMREAVGGGAWLDLTVSRPDDEIGLCDDGEDNDVDGTTDCADADCSGDPYCTGSEICTNGLDDDGDAKVDCEDGDCATDSMCELPTELTCTDGFDNDGDGAVDCLDADCSTDPSCAPEVDCSNGLDDDSDGWTDCADPDCTTKPECASTTETSCSNGVDDDADAAIDCADSDCFTDPACSSGVETSCTNGVDDDGDTSIDCADPDCATDPACASTSEWSCTNGLDDDGNGDVDCCDAACASDPACAIEETYCGDGFDNDGDGAIDCADPGQCRGCSTECVTGTSPLGWPCVAASDCDSGVEAPLCLTTGRTGFAHGICSAWCDPTDPSACGGGADCVALAEDPTRGSCATACVTSDDCSGEDVCRGVDLLAESICGKPCAIDADCATGGWCTAAGYCASWDEDCWSAGDEDRNGYADCDDPACAIDTYACPPPGGENCLDPADADGDGYRGCWDSDCSTVPECAGYEDCWNASDDDADGLIDCNDPECFDMSTCLPTEICDNGLDDDGNGATDCCDWSCIGGPSCGSDETACSDRIDDDYDGLFDCADDGFCQSCSVECTRGTRRTGAPCDWTGQCGVPDGTTRDPMCLTQRGFGILGGLCSDHCTVGVDTCGWGAECLPLFGPGDDGLCGFGCTVDADCRSGEACLDVPGIATGICGPACVVDADCPTTATCDAGRCVESAEDCWFGADEDGDGLTNCDDPDCAAAGWCPTPAPESCTNEFDDDLDGLIDCCDPDCVGDGNCWTTAEEGVTPSQLPDESQCLDGVDQDADGFEGCLDPGFCGSCASVCRTGDRPVGSGCLVDADCASDPTLPGGPAGACLRPAGPDGPPGVCATGCGFGFGTDACGAGGTCNVITDPDGVLPLPPFYDPWCTGSGFECTTPWGICGTTCSSGTPCSGDATCETFVLLDPSDGTTLPATIALCVPACASDADCPSGQWCDELQGECVATEDCRSSDDTDHDGAPGCFDSDCATSDHCTCDAVADCTSPSLPVGAACIGNLDCQDGLTCIQEGPGPGFCTRTCMTSGECASEPGLPFGSVCDSLGTVNACTLGPCTEDAQCGANRVCSRADVTDLIGWCAPACSSVAPCADGNWCAPDGECRPRTEICDNGIDDDTNGTRDCDDPQCAILAECEARLANEGSCSDGVDGDMDGFTDCSDPECAQTSACVFDVEGESLRRVADPAAAARGASTLGPSFFDSISFLAAYGANGPVVFGFSPTCEPLSVGSLDAPPVAVLRGTVRLRGGGPVEAVEVSVHGHDCLGRTWTRPDGTWTLIVPVDVASTVRFSHPHYFDLDRTWTVDSERVVEVDDVALTKRPEPGELRPLEWASSAWQSTTFPTSRHRTPAGTFVERSPMMILPPSTTATWSEGPGGATTSLDSGLAEFFVTEFTQGPDGPNAMPAPLPAQTAYTWAAEIGLDGMDGDVELTTASGELPMLYLQDFVGMKAGDVIPFGFYSRTTGTWFADASGFVLEVDGYTATGCARLSPLTLDAIMDPDRVAEPAFGLPIPDDELCELGQMLKSSGAAIPSLVWRVPIQHFTPWDANLPTVFPSNAEMPPPEVATTGAPDDGCDPTAPGSTLLCRTQVMQQQMVLPGSHLSLTWSAREQAGYRADDVIQLGPTATYSGAMGPGDSGPGVLFDVVVAGRTLERLPSTSELVEDDLLTWVWDGLDAFGRTVEGDVPIEVHAQRFYPALMSTCRETIVDDFNRYPRACVGARTWATGAFNSLHSVWFGTLDAPGAPVTEIGGWTIDGLHHLDVELGRITTLVGPDADAFEGGLIRDVMPREGCTLPGFADVLDVSVRGGGRRWTRQFNRVCLPDSEGDPDCRDETGLTGHHEQLFGYLPADLCSAPDAIGFTEYDSVTATTPAMGHSEVIDLPDGSVLIGTAVHRAERMDETLICWTRNEVDAADLGSGGVMECFDPTATPMGATATIAGSAGGRYLERVDRFTLSPTGEVYIAQRTSATSANATLYRIERPELDGIDDVGLRAEVVVGELCTLTDLDPWSFDPSAPCLRNVVDMTFDGSAEALYIAMRPDEGLGLPTSRDGVILRMGPGAAVEQVVGFPLVEATNALDDGAEVDGRRIDDLTRIAIGPGGELWWREGAPRRIRRIRMGEGGVAPDGSDVPPEFEVVTELGCRAWHVGGGCGDDVRRVDIGDPEFTGDYLTEGPPSPWWNPPIDADFDVTHEGVFFVDTQWHLRLVAMGAFEEDGVYRVPTPNGVASWVFNEWGQHVRTEHAWTGTRIVEYAYHPGGQLAAIRTPSPGAPAVAETAHGDACGAAPGTLCIDERPLNRVSSCVSGPGLTCIDDDGAGTLTVQGPWGGASTLHLDAFNRLERVVRPAGREDRFGYDRDDLMRLHVGPGDAETPSVVSTYAYDDLGRVTHAANSTGRQTHLSRSGGVASYTVTRTDATGATWTYAANDRGATRVLSSTNPGGWEQNTVVEPGARSGRSDRPGGVVTRSWSEPSTEPGRPPTRHTVTEHDEGGTVVTSRSCTATATESCDDGAGTLLDLAGATYATLVTVTASSGGAGGGAETLDAVVRTTVIDSEPALGDTGCTDHDGIAPCLLIETESPAGRTSRRLVDALGRPVWAEASDGRSRVLWEWQANDPRPAARVLQSLDTPPEPERRTTYSYHDAAGDRPGDVEARAASATGPTGTHVEQDVPADVPAGEAEDSRRRATSLVDSTLGASWTVERLFDVRGRIRQITLPNDGLVTRVHAFDTIEHDMDSTYTAPVNASCVDDSACPDGVSCDPVLRTCGAPTVASSWQTHYVRDDAGRLEQIVYPSGSTSTVSMHAGTCTGDPAVRDSAGRCSEGIACHDGGACAATDFVAMPMGATMIERHRGATVRTTTIRSRIDTAGRLREAERDIDGVVARYASERVDGVAADTVNDFVSRVTWTVPVTASSSVSATVEQVADVLGRPDREVVVTADGVPRVADYTVDPDGVLVGIDAEGHTLGVTTSSASGVLEGTGIAIGSGSVHSHVERNAFGEPTLIAWRTGGPFVGPVASCPASDPDLLFCEDLTWDAAGRISGASEVDVEITGSGSTVTTTTDVHTYDPLTSRLTATSRNGVPEWSWSWDENGNPTGVTRAGNGGDTALSLTAGDFVVDGQDRLHRYGNTFFGYDPDGYLLWQRTVMPGDDPARCYDYGIDGALHKVRMFDVRASESDPVAVFGDVNNPCDFDPAWIHNETIVTYRQDAAGRRAVRHEVGPSGASWDIWIYRDALNPVARLNPDGSLSQRYVYGTRGHVPDLLLTYDDVDSDGVDDLTGVYRYVVDLRGSVRALVDIETGYVTQRITYSPFGRELSNSNPGFQPFGFVGGLTDPATGLVRFGARDYDPSIGRWTAKDPIGFGGGQGNWYEYSANRPIDYIDSSGKVPAWVSRVARGTPVVVFVAASIDLALALYAQEDAERMADAAFVHPEMHEAFRHCYASCTLTQASGARVAFLAGHGFELITELAYRANGDWDQSYAADRDRDVENNLCGRVAGADGESCLEACFNATQSGGLATQSGAVYSQQQDDSGIESAAFVRHRAVELYCGSLWTC